MRPKEFLLYAAGTVFALAGAAAVIALVVAAIIALPAVGALFPGTIAVALLVLGVLYWRHRRKQREERERG